MEFLLPHLFNSSIIRLYPRNPFLIIVHAHSVKFVKQHKPKTHTNKLKHTDPGCDCDAPIPKDAAAVTHVQCQSQEVGSRHRRPRLLVFSFLIRIN